MKTYQIALPDEFAAFVDRMIAERKIDDLDHLFLYAIAQVEDEERRDESIDQEWLKKEIQKGIDSADRGELAPLDMAAIWARVEWRLAGEKQEALMQQTDIADDESRTFVQSGVALGLLFCHFSHS